MTVLFCNVAWMVYYNGENEENFKKATAKNCSYNFQDYNGACYGMMSAVPQIVTKTKNDVTVIWTSHDEYQEADVVIGWYKNATIYQTEQIEPDQYGIGRELHYFAKASSTDCFLLATEERNFLVTEESKNNPDFLMKLLIYIDDIKLKSIHLCLDGTNISRVLYHSVLSYEELMESGENSIDQKEYYRALVFFNTAFHLEKTIDAIFNIAAMLETLCCFKDAIQVFEKLRELEGDEADTLDNLLNLYMQTKNYDQALVISNLAISKSENIEEICGFLCIQADIYLEQKYPDRAMTSLDFIIKHTTDRVMKREAERYKQQLSEKITL